MPALPDVDSDFADTSITVQETFGERSAQILHVLHCDLFGKTRDEICRFNRDVSVKFASHHSPLIINNPCIIRGARYRTSLIYIDGVPLT